MVNWLAELDVELFVSHRRLQQRKSLPRARAPWALDSGGYTELFLNGRWTISASDYAAAAERYRSEIGLLAWAAPQDWMCEPWMLEKTGLSIREHQERTVANFLELRSIAPGLPFIPVLQGLSVEDYLTCWELYESAGILLEQRELVGLGTMCRRQDTGTAEDVILALRELRLHGFGCKSGGLARYGYLLASADSMAWSTRARKDAEERRQLGKPSRSHGLASCANCSHFALEWRERTLRPRAQQIHLGVGL